MDIDRALLFVRMFNTRLRRAPGSSRHHYHQWRIYHDANDAMAWGPPLKGPPEQLSDFFGMGPISLLIVLLDIDIFPMLSK